MILHGDDRVRRNHAGGRDRREAYPREGGVSARVEAGEGRFAAIRLRCSLAGAVDISLNTGRDYWLCLMSSLELSAE